VITFNIEGSRTFGDAPLTLAATSSSGLAVLFTTPGSAVATLNGNVLTFIAPGSVTIHADQAGNASFNAATRVSRTFCVNPPKPTITASGLNTEAPVLTSSSTTGNQWYLGDAAIASATNATLTVTGAGVFKVKATIDGCSSVFSDNFTFVITDDESPDHSEVSLFPNPASDRLFVTLPSTIEKKVVSIHAINGSQTDLKETKEREMQFDIATYSQGIYFVRVSTSNSTRFIRFIKN
jgi:hypothetical protein